MLKFPKLNSDLHDDNGEDQQLVLCHRLPHADAPPHAERNEALWFGFKNMTFKKNNILVKTDIPGLCIFREPSSVSFKNREGLNAFWKVEKNLSFPYNFNFFKKIRFYRVSPVLGICVEAVDVVVDICLWKSKKKKLNNSLLDLWET